MKEACFTISVYLLLTACGGGANTETPMTINPPNPTVDPPSPTFFGEDSDVDLALEALLIDSTALSVSTERGTLNQTTDRITLGNLAGDISDDRLFVQLDDNGGVADLTQTPLDYVAFVQLSPGTGNPSSGVIGLPSETAVIPTSGSAEFAGVDTARLSIVAPELTLDLIGDTFVQVSFSNGRVLTRLDGLDGKRFDASQESAYESDAATLTIGDAILDGAGFSGGEAELVARTGGIALSSNAIVQSTGHFFGPDATEVGGTFVIDDGAGSSTLLIGQYLANNTLANDP